MNWNDLFETSFTEFVMIKLKTTSVNYPHSVINFYCLYSTGISTWIFVIYKLKIKPDMNLFCNDLYFNFDIY